MSVIEKEQILQVFASLLGQEVRVIPDPTRQRVSGEITLGEENVTKLTRFIKAHTNDRGDLIFPLEALSAVRQFQKDHLTSPVQIWRWVSLNGSVFTLYPGQHLVEDADYGIARAAWPKAEEREGSIHNRHQNTPFSCLELREFLHDPVASFQFVANHEVIWFAGKTMTPAEFAQKYLGDRENMDKIMSEFLEEEKIIAGRTVRNGGALEARIENERVEHISKMSDLYGLNVYAILPDGNTGYLVK